MTNTNEMNIAALLWLVCSDPQIVIISTKVRLISLTLISLLICLVVKKEEDFIENVIKQADTAFPVRPTLILFIGSI